MSWPEAFFYSVIAVCVTVWLIVMLIGLGD